MGGGVANISDDSGGGVCLMTVLEVRFSLRRLRKSFQPASLVGDELTSQSMKHLIIAKQ